MNGYFDNPTGWHNIYECLPHEILGSIFNGYKISHWALDQPGHKERLAVSLFFCHMNGYFKLYKKIYKINKFKHYYF